MITYRGTLNKKIMEKEMTYPTGTTKEQWDRYDQDLAKHEEFYHDYAFYLDRILRHLEWVRPSNTWTTDDIKKTIACEIDRARSMDAPNKPGYEFANND